MTATFEPGAEHFARLERIFASTPIHRYWRCTIVLSEAAAELQLPVRSEFFNPLGTLHGSAYCKALDTAMFFAANSLVPDVLLTTTEISLSFLRPIASGTLTARGRVVHRGHRRLVAEGSAFDETGRELARALGSFMPTSLKLSDLDPGCRRDGVDQVLA